MKKALCPFIVSLIIAPALTAEPPAFFSNVTNLWYQGQMSNVLEIAAQRLAANPNDFAGLLLKMEYELNSEFDDLSCVSNSILAALAVSTNITTALFSQLKEDFQYSLEDFLELLSDERMLANKEEDKAKAFLPGKRMLFEEDLLAACLDGLATNLPPAQQ